jgi:hypothetical protein
LLLKLLLLNNKLYPRIHLFRSFRPTNTTILSHSTPNVNYLFKVFYSLVNGGLFAISFFNKQIPDFQPLF